VVYTQKAMSVTRHGFFIARASRYLRALGAVSRSGFCVLRAFYALKAFYELGAHETRWAGGVAAGKLFRKKRSLIRSVRHCARH